MPVSLFGVSLSQASFPALADEAAHSDLTKFKQTLAKSLSQIFFFALPASILVLILRIPLVRLAFGARTFPWEATLLTGKSLAFLALSIAPLAVTQVLVRAFHALKDTRRPLYVGAFTMIIFTLSATYASRVLGYGVLGITAAMSLSNYLDFIFSLSPSPPSHRQPGHYLAVNQNDYRLWRHRLRPLAPDAPSRSVRF